MKYTSIIFIFLLSATGYSAEFIPKKLSQMADDLGVGTHTADTSDPHGASITQTNLTVGSLTVTGNLNAAITGYIAQNGTGTLSAATIAGVTAPYIAQTNGTGTGVSLFGNTGIGTTTADVGLDIFNSDVDLERNGGIPLLSIFRSGTPLANNVIGYLPFYALDSANNTQKYGGVYVSQHDINHGSETGSIIFETVSNATIGERMRIREDKVGIGTSTPANKLTVVGTIESTTGGVKFPDGNTQTEAITQFVKGIVAGTGISINQSTGTVTITNTGTSSAGGWTDGTNTVYTTVAADQVIIGSTTAQASRILTVVGDTKLDGQTHLKGTLGLGSVYPLTGGNPTIEFAIGDNDTGIGYVSDGIYSLIANGNTMMKLDGTTEKIAIGTTTFGTKLNVGGTVTASGFSGNGAGLTNLPSSPVAFSEVTGSATSEQLPTVVKLYGTTTQQVAGAYGQLYVQSVSSGDISFGTLTTDSLVSYYRLEDLSDNFGSSNLTNYGTTTFASGKYGTCATFNGTTQYLQTSVLSTATTNISMFDWVYIASASEARPFFNNGIDGADTNGYALGVGTATMETAGNCLIGHLHGVVWLNFNTVIGTGWHHVGMTRDGTTWRGYIDKVQCVTTFTDSPIAPSGSFTIARNYSGGVNRYYNDKIDDVVFYNKCLSAAEIVELYNNTGGYRHTEYSAKYADPVNGNTVFEIFTPGTVTTQASYIYNNATTTVFGLGTNTAITATTTAYSGWFDGAVRATAFNVASTEKIKENIKPIKIKPDILDAEGMAKLNYIANNKIAWIAANSGSYTTVVNETGTGSVIVVDTDTMESDYNNYIEFEWAADINQDIYTENIQKQYEKGFWQMFDSVTPKSWNPKDKPTLTRKGFVVEDMPPIVWGDDGKSLDLGAILAYMTVAQKTLREDSIFALSTLKELITTGTVTQQKIDYCNDRLEVLNP